MNRVFPFLWLKELGPQLFIYKWCREVWSERTPLPAKRVRGGGGLSFVMRSEERKLYCPLATLCTSPKALLSARSVNYIAATCTKLAVLGLNRGSAQPGFAVWLAPRSFISCQEHPIQTGSTLRAGIGAHTNTPSISCHWLFNLCLIIYFIQKYWFQYIKL
jgi:hypothetical protein